MPSHDVVGELQGLGLLNRVARLIESLVLEHGGHVDGDNGGVNQEVLTLAMEVEPGHIAGAGAVRSESAKLGPPFLPPRRSALRAPACSQQRRIACWARMA